MFKTFLRAIVFVVLMLLIISCLQPVYILKRNDGGVAFAQFYNEPRDSLDVLMSGSSGMYGGILPAVLWDEIGVTSYNLGMSYMTGAAQYYILKEALRYQSPRVVIIEGELLFTDDNFDGSEETYRQALDHMRLSPAKLGSITDIISKSENQAFIDYLLPLLRYHDRRDIEAYDYDLAYKKQRNPYMGAWFAEQTEFKSQTRIEQPVETDEMPAVFDEYLIKITGLCRERGIEVIIVQAPRCAEEDLTTTRLSALQDFADKHGVRLFDFNTPELYSEAGFDDQTDFFNDDHVNLIGAEKLTRYIARFLQETYSFPDKRKAPYDPHWDAVLELHKERLNMLIDDLTGDD